MHLQKKLRKNVCRKTISEKNIKIVPIHPILRYYRNCFFFYTVGVTSFLFFFFFTFYFFTYPRHYCLSRVTDTPLGWKEVRLMWV